jgi:hypothetical protein
MTSAERTQLIAELSQTVIAVLVIIGGGWALVAGSPSSNEILPFVAMVIGFYFGRQLKVGAGTNTVTTTTPGVDGGNAATTTTTKAPTT